MSPPRKLISVFGVIDAALTGIEMGTVISFPVNPFAVKT